MAMAADNILSLSWSWPWFAFVFLNQLAFEAYFDLEDTAVDAANAIPTIAGKYGARQALLFCALCWLLAAVFAGFVGGAAIYSASALLMAAVCLLGDEQEVYHLYEIFPLAIILYLA